MVRLGYACINETLAKQKISCNKKCVLKTIFKQQDPYNFLIEIGRKNLQAVLQILKWNVNHRIFFYRMSSSMFPHIGNPKIKELLGESKFNQYLDLKPFKDLLVDIKEYAKRYKIRLTVHPGQFCQLASPRPQVVKNSIIDLTWHCNLLDAVGDQDSTICIHGGGTWNDKKSALKRLEEQILALPSNIKARICLENCEKSWMTEDLLPVCVKLGIPLIFDFFHYTCYSLYHPETKQKSISELMPMILKTWKTKRPKFHISQQAKNL